ncbi:copper homeostasis protein CutC [Aggregatimonas sangjinii]|uniref:PF03932 family protein CutC n=1 Tax=Aggregatimonas sangjinii TaxID=2583587 RepID=A0A5B7SVR1_9FLAO|nr:copper homeostasis protein CutC [Aggregatimonas sangjinii]QCX01243.1 copper homeostasis protein CutC [Aggregatimonas sangjinii]
MLVEVCANSFESALNAQRAGADRIELCSELAVGGVTPSYGLLKAVSEKISIPVRVLIRPRSGDFTYSDAEFDIMKQDIKLCNEMGFDGIAIGLLHPNFVMDERRHIEIGHLAAKLKITFHRAFDWVADPILTLQKLDDLGIDTILSSGQQPSALEGIDFLTELSERASHTIIMPGSGINAGNAHLFKERGFKAIHLSAVQMNQTLQESPKVSMNSPRMLSDDSVAVSHFETIQEIVRAVK